MPLKDRFLYVIWRVLVLQGATMEVLQEEMKIKEGLCIIL